jgi:hypothetical protein
MKQLYIPFLAILLTNLSSGPISGKKTIPGDFPTIYGCRDIQTCNMGMKKEMQDL